MITIFKHFQDNSTLAQIKRRWHKRVLQVYEILRIWVLENVMDTTRPAGLQKTSHFESLHPAASTDAFATTGSFKMLL